MQPTTLSGIPYYLIQTLSKKYELIIIDNKNIHEFGLNPFVRLFARSLKYSSKFLQRRFNQIYFQFTGVEISNCYLLARRLKKICGQYKDVPVLTFGLSATRFYKGNSKIFQFIDGIYSGKIDYYADRNKITTWEEYNIKKTDLNGIRNSESIFCSSETIRLMVSDFILKNSDTQQTNIIDIGIGSNIPEVASYHKAKDESEINICFIYSNFYRKGGDIVLNIAKLSEGSNWRFHFIGKTPEIEISDYKNAQFHGFIDKKNQLDDYLDIIKSCSVNIMPTRGDLTPHVICECNAYGVPTIANDIGGIKDLIGKGGILVNGLDESEYINGIKTIVNEFDRRSHLSYEIYLKEQRWSVVGDKLSHVIS